MRFRHDDGSLVHLAYCTNVHPADDLDGVVDQLARFAGPVRDGLGVAVLGVGLWIPADLAGHLVSDARAFERLRRALDGHCLEVVTLNGFPYRAFHAAVVKDDVYRPDWTDPKRLEYTLNLAQLASRLLPATADEATISTLPLGWRRGWSPEHTEAALARLHTLGEELDRLSDVSGRRVRVGIEPEPGCAIETIGEAAQALGDFEGDHLGVCLDACHAAVQFEDAAQAVAALSAAGVPVVKMQISAALRSAPPDTSMLSRFVEPRYLHQTRERLSDGEIAGVDDLSEALGHGLPGKGEWRVHFHVPIHVGGGDTTQPQLESTLATTLAGPAPLTHHLEVETYTWTVLPPDRRPRDEQGIINGIVAELEWTRARLLELGLEEVAA